EYARLSGRQRRFIKGQKYTLLSHRENLTLEGRQALQTRLAANKRLNIAYLLKESFGQLWGYEREGWARRFFENWRAALKGQRLAPYEKFAEMIDRHWDGIAAYGKPENKVSLGFVEGCNNKIRVIQRRAYGLRDEEYLRLKILTCMLPKRTTPMTSTNRVGNGPLPLGRMVSLSALPVFIVIPPCFVVARSVELRPPADPCGLSCGVARLLACPILTRCLRR